MTSGGSRGSLRELDKLLQSTVFETQQQSLEIETENQKIQVYQRRIEERRTQIQEMKTRTASYRERVNQLSQRSRQLKESNECMAKNLNMLDEHKATLIKKVRATISATQQQRAEMEEALSKYREKWKKYEEYYEKSDKARELRDAEDELQRLNTHKKALEEQLQMLQLRRSQHPRIAGAWKEWTSFVVKLAELKVDTNHNCRKIQQFVQLLVQKRSLLLELGMRANATHNERMDSDQLQNSESCSEAPSHPPPQLYAASSNSGTLACQTSPGRSRTDLSSLTEFPASRGEQRSALLTELESQEGQIRCSGAQMESQANGPGRQTHCLSAPFTLELPQRHVCGKENENNPPLPVPRRVVESRTPRRAPPFLSLPMAPQMQTTTACRPPRPAPPPPSLTISLPETPQVHVRPTTIACRRRPPPQAPPLLSLSLDPPRPPNVQRTTSRGPRPQALPPFMSESLQVQPTTTGALPSKAPPSLSLSLEMPTASSIQSTIRRSSLQTQCTLSSSMDLSKSTAVSRPPLQSPPTLSLPAEVPRASRPQSDAAASMPPPQTAPSALRARAAPVVSMATESAAGAKSVPDVSMAIMTVTAPATVPEEANISLTPETYVQPGQPYGDGKESNTVPATTPTAAALPTVTKATDTSFTSEPTLQSGLPNSDQREGGNATETQWEDHNVAAMEIESQGEQSGEIGPAAGRSVESYGIGATPPSVNSTEPHPQGGAVQETEAADFGAFSWFGTEQAHTADMFPTEVPGNQQTSDFGSFFGNNFSADSTGTPFSFNFSDPSAGGETGFSFFDSPSLQNGAKENSDGMSSFSFNFGQSPSSGSALPFF